MILERQYLKVEEFLALSEQPEYADRRVELIEGEIVEMPHPSPLHAAILADLSASLTLYGKRTGQGRVFAGNAPFILERSLAGRDTLRGIDIAFVAADRLPPSLPTKPFSIAPDLAVEIISPSNSAADIEKKIQQLLRAGTRLIWIVYPELRCVIVHRASGSVTLSDSDILSGGDVLPGFTLAVADIFPN